MRSVLVFGASGSIGQAICTHFHEQGFRVFPVVRHLTSHVRDVSLKSIIWTGDGANFCEQLKIELSDEKLDSVVWAQGVNFNDDIDSFDADSHMQMYEANVVFILRSLQVITKAKLLANDARLCIISSIWQNIARQSKLSYCVTKSALQGLVQSLAIDLGKRGILINAVLPGALDTPMTRSNLTPSQIESLELATPLQSLAKLNDVTGLVHYLCSLSNAGITGQFIAADRGFSNARIL